MTTFQEQFPELNKLWFIAETPEDEESSQRPLINCEDVQRFCLSKQRVKEALMKYHEEHSCSFDSSDLKNVLRTLGLEEEENVN